VATRSAAIPSAVGEPEQDWRETGQVAVPDAPAEEPDLAWREELSKRVENFRKRRARLQQPADSTENFELDFYPASESDESLFLDEVRGSAEESVPAFDADLGAPSEAVAGRGQTLETTPFQKADEEEMPLEVAPVPEEDIPWESVAPDGHPMEIVVGLPGDHPHGEDDAGTITLAPVGYRFLAGLTDALVLVISTALFGVIFWRSGGHLTSTPLNLGVAAAIVIFFIFSYFGLFTALTSTTPGLLWMGCEIRNLYGDPPTARESFWRAFGLLVSLSALMLGFIWAWVDSESLTWHDRMSGTCIALVQSGREPSHQEK
jgi:uncharacterized RDD family membrane protein YckC